MMKIRIPMLLGQGLAVLLAMGGVGTAVAQTDDTYFGTGAFASNTGDFNSAFGFNALNANTSDGNTAVGANALQSNTSGSANVAIGLDVLISNSTGTYNTAIGAVAMYYNSTGSNNTASGQGALEFNSTGSNNTATGYRALNANSTGSYENAVGYSALYSNTTGMYNTAVGGDALYSNTTASYNTGLGDYALYLTTTGGYNNGQGYGALYHNTTGAYNAAMGVYSLFSNSTGNNNIAMGQLAGYYVTGSNTIEIGNKGAAADNNLIRIGTPGTQAATYIAGVSGVNVTGGATVVVNSSGQLGVMSSSRRYKEDIRSMGNTSDRLLELRPVTFRYRQADENGQKPEQYGLIAEEVAEVMPELVVYNQDGQPETVAYQTLTPLLLNAFKREHEQVLSLTRRMASQEKLLRAMARQLAERDSPRPARAEVNRAAENRAVSAEE